MTEEAENDDSLLIRLPVIEDCSGCSACCQRTPVPPFYPGEEAVLNVPDDLLDAVRERIAADQQFELLPCVWLDMDAGLCRHYELRPKACRDFQTGSDLCRLSRWDEGLDR